MPATIDAPPAPPPGVKIIPPATPPKPPPAPTTTIKLGAPRDPGPNPEPPKPGSARERMSASLRQKAGITEPTAPPAPAPQPAPEPSATATPPEPVEPQPDPGTPPPATTEPPPAAPGDKVKTNPWKVVEQWKGKAAELEKQLADAKTASLPEHEKKGYLTQIEQLSKRNTELEDEMRFVNYQQSDEFKTKFDEPYQKAFNRAVQEMSELTITDPQSQATRPVTANDIVMLANLPLAEARKVANELYGDFADDMMAHRKEIRNLYNARAEALAEAKTKGAEREKQRLEMFQKTNLEIQDFIKTTWNSVNEAAVHHETYGKYFTPIDGDQDGNQRLAKGFELVDRAFSENPNDPRLTADQRTAIIKRHAAVRNRAAATGRLISWLNQRDARIAELEKELGEIKGTTPRTGGTPTGGEGGPTATATGPARDQVFGALRKLAR